MQPPNIANLFVPGGVVFSFDPGTGAQDLGLMEKAPDVECKATEIKVYNNRSGKRRLIDILTTEEEVTWNFALEEVVPETLVAFFKGDALVPMMAGTAAITGVLLTLNGELPSSLAGYYGISAVVVKNAAGTATYVRNVDYIMDPGQVGPGLLEGRIGRLAGGAITNGQQVQVSFTYTTWSSLRFNVANAEYQQGAATLVFAPLNGFQWRYTVPRCLLKPQGKFTFDDKKVLECPLTLQVLDATILVQEGLLPAGTPPFGYWDVLPSMTS